MSSQVEAALRARGPAAAEDAPAAADVPAVFNKKRDSNCKRNMI